VGPAPRRRRLLALAGLGTVGVAVALIAALVFGRGSPPALAGVDFDHVGIVDPHSNKIIGEIAVGQRPAAVAVGDGSVWVANAGSGTVMRIDPRTRRVTDIIGIGGPASSLAVTKDAVWVGNGSAGTVTRIDPSSDSIVGAPIDLRGGNPVVPNGVQSLAVANGSLWVAVGPRALLRLDLRTGEQTWIALGSPPLAVVAGAGAVWVTTGDERLFRIDATTGRPAEPLSIRIGVDLAVGYGSVWVMDGGLSAFDTGTLVSEGGVPAGGFPIAVATGYGAVWWIDNFGGVLYRTDPTDMQRQTKISLGHSHPADIAVGYGEVWVCAQ
jgi:YVTN family beta-propeller protein